MLAGAVSAAALLAGLPRGENSPAPALAEIERIVDLAGFGLTQVSLTGHRFTLDSDIFEALDLGSAPTMLSFDSRAAQDRIERLPWVERASIERIVPDRLEVRISERAPFAVWRRDTRHLLIDRTGRVLASVAPDAMPELPRIAGEGAATAVGRLMDLLASQPALAHQVMLAERIGGRRWALHLADGSTMQLPAAGEARSAGARPPDCRCAPGATGRDRPESDGAHAGARAEAERGGAHCGWRNLVRRWRKRWSGTCVQVSEQAGRPMASSACWTSAPARPSASSSPYPRCSRR